MMNINLNVPLPRTDFKNVTAQKWREKLSEIRGETITPDSAQKKEEQKDIGDQKLNEQDQQSEKKGMPAWVKAVIWILILGIGLPILSYIFDQIARVVKSARSVETAFS